MTLKIVAILSVYHQVLVFWLVVCLVFGLVWMAVFLGKIPTKFKYKNWVFYLAFVSFLIALILIVFLLGVIEP